MRKTTALIHLLKERELMLALAESVTCGLAAHQLTTAKGASEVFRGGVICYQENVKKELLQVSSRLIDRYTAESQQVTDALAKNLPHIIEADVYAALTGLASPGGSEHKDKPVGTVFFSVLYKKKLHHERALFRGSPLLIKKKACDHLYALLISIIEKQR